MRHRLLLAFLPLLLAAQTPERDYPALLAEAQSLAAENSWERARERYTDALALAPDADARRWLELWILDATWRSEQERWWEEGPVWRQRHQAAYDSLEQPFTAGQPYDDFWAALLTSRADLEQIFDPNAAWKLRDAIARYLGSHPPSPAAAHRYIAFLQNVLALTQSPLPAAADPFRHHLQNGARVAANPDDRAWCLWQLAQLEFTEPRENERDELAPRAARWAAALAASPQTSWENLIRAGEFAWRLTSRWAPDAAPDSPADIPAQLAELRRLREALQAVASRPASELVQQLDQIESSLITPRLEIEAGTLFAPDLPVRFSYGTAGLDRLVFSLDQVTAETWLRLSDSHGLLSIGRSDNSKISRPRPASIVREWETPLPPSTTFAWRSEIVEAASSLKPGYYVLTARATRTAGEPVLAQTRFLVSSLRALAVTGGKSHGRIFVFRANDGTPIQSATVDAVAGNNSPVRHWQTRTDPGGAFETPALEPSQYLLAATVAGEPIALFYYPPFTPSSQLFVDTFTDRPLFRPGETAHWKLIARERRDGRFVLPTSLDDIRFRVMLRDTPLVDTTPLQLDPHGTLSGDIVLPRDARAGDAVLQIFRGNPANPRANLAWTPLFAVDRYVPPAVVAKVTLASPPATVRPGEQLQLRVDASYFSGGPLAGARVQLTMTVNQPWLWTESLSRWTAEIAGEPLENSTRPDGSAEFTLALPPDLPDGVTLEFAATVLPDAGTPAHASTELTVSSSGLSVDPLGWTSPRLARPGDSIVFSTTVRDPQAEPTSFDGHAQLLELRWNEVWLDGSGRVVPPEELAAAWRAAGGPDRHVPEDWILVHSGYAETIVADQPVTAGSDGRIEAGFELPRAGVFRLRLFGDREITAKPQFRPGRIFNSRRRSSEGKPEDVFREIFSLVAVDENTTHLPLNPETAALVVPAEFVPGTPLQVLGIAPEGMSLAWMSANGESEAITHSLPLRGRLALERFDQTPATLGHVAVQFTYASLTGFRSHLSSQIPTSPRDLRIHVAVSPTAHEQRPGSSTQLTVRAQTSSNQPAADALIALAVSDDAVHTLANAVAALKKPQFLEASSTLPTQAFWSTGHVLDPNVQRDPRIGAVLNPTEPGSDADLVVLTPFSVAATADRGYRAAQTLGQAERKAKMESPAIARMEAVAQTSAPPSPVVLRHHFSSTAFWAPALATDANGEARVDFDYPDNLTRWRIDAYALGRDANTFGSAQAFTRTSLPFQARLNLPRFLIAGDSVWPSATLVNRSDHELRAEPTLSLDGPIEPAAAFNSISVVIEENSETSTSWPVRATAPGEARLTLSARAGNESDAMQLSLPVLEDGIQQTTAAFGRLPADSPQNSFALDLPATLDPARTRVTVQFAPNYAITLLDALPYLVDYPYGCVEQTMSRFLPAVVVRKTLQDLGLDPAAVERRILAGETAADRTRRESTAGLDSLDEVIRQSLARLADARTPQGFGWWPGSASPDLWMTAYVVWGLALAEDAGVEVPDALARESAAALARALQSTDVIDDRVAFAWAALARSPHADDLLSDDKAREHFSRLFATRDRLSASGRAALVLAGRFANPEQAATLLRNLDNGVQRSSAAGLGETVHWGAKRDFWRATESAVESTALTLLALLEADPHNPLVDPAAHWLALNRRSAHWSSTRDTAFAILALNAWLSAHGDLDATGEIELLVNDTAVHRFAYTRASLLESPTHFDIPLSALRGGTNEFTLRHSAGQNSVLATALASSWARGSEVQPASHLIETSRRFVRQKAEPTLLGELRITPEPLDPAGIVRPTEQVTARITLTVPNALEYLMIEVPKPAGCEPLNPLSGWDARLVRLPALSVDDPKNASTPDPGRPLYREEHDDRSVFFLDRIEAGTWELRFALRAVTPGDFRALPVTATAMYVPEITANSDSRRLRIQR